MQADEPYTGLIFIPVEIPARLIEGEMAPSEYEEIEERVLAMAEWELQSLVNQFKEAQHGV